jgi:large subunit ribosomal protein L25
MRRDITIVAVPRDERGKNEARRLRAKGRVPAVVYGAGAGATPVTVDPKEINGILFSSTGHNTIFDVEIAGQGVVPAMIVAWQHDPVRNSLMHVDLERIDLTRKLKVKVPVHPVGEPRGVKQQGGLMEIVHREIEIECLPDDIPGEYSVDVRELMIGQNVRAQDIPLGAGVDLKSHADMVICHVIAKRAAPAEEAAAAPAEAAKPAEEKKDESKEAKKSKE